MSKSEKFDDDVQYKDIILENIIYLLLEEIDLKSQQYFL